MSLIIVTAIVGTYVLVVGYMAYDTYKQVQENHKAHKELVKQMQKTIDDIDKILLYRDSFRKYFSTEESVDETTNQI